MQPSVRQMTNAESRTAQGTGKLFQFLRVQPGCKFQFQGSKMNCTCVPTNSHGQPGRISTPYNQRVLAKLPTATLSGFRNSPLGPVLQFPSHRGANRQRWSTHRGSRDLRTNAGPWGHSCHRPGLCYFRSLSLPNTAGWLLNEWMNT